MRAVGAAPQTRWVLRWDTHHEASPSVQRCTVDACDLHAAPDGSFTLFDGSLFEPCTPSGASPAERVAAVYAARRDDLFDTLRGAFTVAHWDAARARLLLGRDATGLGTAFFRFEDGLLLFASSMWALLAASGVRPRVRRVVVAEYLSGVIPSQQLGETFFEGVQRLPPAHRAVFGRTTSRIERYWDPVPPGFSWACEDEVATFPTLFERAVARSLDAGADALALSGGFDSVGIALVAAQQRGRGRPLHALSLRFPDRSCDEGDTQTAVARALGMPHVLKPVGESLAEGNVVGSALALSGSSPSPVLNVWQSLYDGLFQCAADVGARAILMGTGGDELLSVDLAYGADRLAAGDVRGLWRFFRSWQRTSPYSAAYVARIVLWRHAVRPAISRALRARAAAMAPATVTSVTKRRARAVPSWLAPDRQLREELLERRFASASAPRARCEGEGAYVGVIRELPQSPIMALEIDQSRAWTDTRGQSIMLPFFDKDLFGLMLRVHPERLIEGGRAKGPLRRFVRERCPVALPARKVDFTAMLDDVLRSHGLRAWGDLASAAGSPGSALSRLGGEGIVAPGEVCSLMEGYFRASIQGGLFAWQVLSAEAWLRAQG